MFGSEHTAVCDVGLPGFMDLRRLLMRRILMATAACALFVLPAVSHADDRAVPGAATGAIIGGATGAVVGGPVGAAVGAGVGGTVGAGVATSPRDDVIIEHRRAPAVRERTCVRDANGNMICQQIRR